MTDISPKYDKLTNRRTANLTNTLKTPSFLRKWLPVVHCIHALSTNHMHISHGFLVQSLQKYIVLLMSDMG